MSVISRWFPGLRSGTRPTLKGTSAQILKQQNEPANEFFGGSQSPASIGLLDPPEMPTTIISKISGPKNSVSRTVLSKRPGSQQESDYFPECLPGYFQAGYALLRRRRRQTQDVLPPFPPDFPDCTACPVGTYKPFLGDAPEEACAPCEAFRSDTTTVVEGSGSDSDCGEYPARLTQLWCDTPDLNLSEPPPDGVTCFNKLRDSRLKKIPT